MLVKIAENVLILLEEMYLCKFMFCFLVFISYLCIKCAVFKMSWCCTVHMLSFITIHTENRMEVKGTHEKISVILHKPYHIMIYQYIKLRWNCNLHTNYWNYICKVHFTVQSAEPSINIIYKIWLLWHEKCHILTLL